MDKVEFLEQEEEKISCYKMEHNRYNNARVYKLLDTTNGYFTLEARVTH